MTCGGVLLLALLGMGLGLAGAFPARRVWLLGSLLGAAAAMAAAVWVLTTGGTWDWQPGFNVGGAPVHLKLDGLSAFFLALLAVLGGAGSLYAQEYWSDERHPASAPAGRAWWSFMLVNMGLALLSADGLHFLIAWELFAVSGYFLMTPERQRREVRAGGWVYLAASHLGTLCLLAFFAGLAVRTGSWELGPMRGQPQIAPLFWLALIGFGIKAGLFPLHFWLPSAHANAPSHVSAIFSGAVIKMGVYGLVRFSGWLTVPDAAGWVVSGLGGLSAVLGVVFALGQHDLKRLLAYHSVENIGIILLGLGFAMIASAHGQATWGRLALAGALLHVWNHGLFKGLLFFGAGSVVHSTGTREMSRLGGLWRVMPWTAGLFGLGAVAIVGLPPLNGFVSEWLVFLGLFGAVSAHGVVAWGAIPGAVFLGVTGALALACFAKACGLVFLGEPRTQAVRNAHEVGWPMRLPMIVLAIMCVAIGLAPVLFWQAIVHAATVWQPAWSDSVPPAPLLTLGAFQITLAALAVLGVVLLWRRVRHNGFSRAPTWDCGYAAPTARMQYTTGSFASIITGWFAWILWPQRDARLPEGLFPDGSRLEEHIPETVLENVVKPTSSVILRISNAARRLQHGRLQAYILYMLIGLAALVILALMGGAK